MTSIERTAYPRLKISKPYGKSDLEKLFRPLPNEVCFAWKQARSDQSAFNFLLQLKLFQCLGYFPDFSHCPSQIVNHIRTTSGFNKSIVPEYKSAKTKYRHRNIIRDYLKITQLGKESRRSLLKQVLTSAGSMDNPADLINVAIEHLVKERIELPSFNEIDKLCGHCRAFVNQSIFTAVANRLSKKQVKSLERLLITEESEIYSKWNTVKEGPASSTLSHLKDAIDQLTWLKSLGDFSSCLQGFPDIKIRHFASIGKMTDARNMRLLRESRRLAVVVCTIHRMQVKAHDDLVTMFIKRVKNFHSSAKNRLEAHRAETLANTRNLLTTLSDIIAASSDNKTSLKAIGQAVKAKMESQGGTERLLEQCDNAIMVNTNNHLPFVHDFFKSHRAALYRMVETLSFGRASSDDQLLVGLKFIVRTKDRKTKTVEYSGSLAFLEKQWLSLVLVDGLPGYVNRKEFEVSIFSALVGALKSGDIFVNGSEEFADYRKQLLPWSECQEQLEDYFAEVSLPGDAKSFTDHTKESLKDAIMKADRAYKKQRSYSIDDKGIPSVTKTSKRTVASTVRGEQELVLDQMPERTLIEILCNTHHWINWTRHFGPLWGGDAKMDEAIERYILTTFAYGANLGATQTAKHYYKPIHPDAILLVNRQHSTVKKLDGAIKDHVDLYDRLGLPKTWGQGKSASADGTKYDVYEQNLLAEYHIRYGGYGGIAYHHVADSYIALFTSFIPCGTWEAIHILEGLLKNESTVQPEILHADSQGQSAAVFAFAYLLGIKLMPRIRGFKGMKFLKHDKDAKLKNLKNLFSHTANWDLIESNWKDIMQVVLSVRSGKISSSMILRKLGNYSRKNHLYKAFRELGLVIRTLFLIEYITEPEVRRTIDSETNKVESFHRFSKWMSFGDDDTIRENDPETQEKIIKYNHLLANAVILQNAVDLENAIKALAKKGVTISTEAQKGMSPYVTGHLKRFGPISVDLSNVPPPIDSLH